METSAALHLLYMHLVKREINQSRAARENFLSIHSTVVTKQFLVGHYFILWATAL